MALLTADLNCSRTVRASEQVLNCDSLATLAPRGGLECVISLSAWSVRAACASTTIHG